MKVDESKSMHVIWRTIRYKTLGRNFLHARTNPITQGGLIPANRWICSRKTITKEIPQSTSKVSIIFMEHHN
jgi:hypothetical protein